MNRKQSLHIFLGASAHCDQEGVVYGYSREEKIRVSRHVLQVIENFY